ncbi:MAG: hypothetical protein ACPGU7_11560 [Gammaproteobacteria bacterium]
MCIGVMAGGPAVAGLGADTAITRVDGGAAAIDTIKAGAVLEGADGHPLPVMARFAHGPVSGAVKITTEAGRSLILTPEHAVITPAGGVPAATVAIGDHVVSIDGVDTVAGVETLPRGGRVVTLMPAPGRAAAQHFANGLLVDMAGSYGPGDIRVEMVSAPVPPSPPAPEESEPEKGEAGQADTAAAEPDAGMSPGFSMDDVPPWMMMGYPPNLMPPGISGTHPGAVSPGGAVRPQMAPGIHGPGSQVSGPYAGPRVGPQGSVARSYGYMPANPAPNVYAPTGAYTPPGGPVWRGVPNTAYPQGRFANGPYPSGPYGKRPYVGGPHGNGPYPGYTWKGMPTPVGPYAQPGPTGY